MISFLWLVVGEIVFYILKNKNIQKNQWDSINFIFIYINNELIQITQSFS